MLFYDLEDNVYFEVKCIRKPLESSYLTSFLQSFIIFLAYHCILHKFVINKTKWQINQTK